MCIVKTPKVTAAEQKVKDPTIIRNAYLDGTGPQIKALRMGRSSLRIERAGGAASTAAPSVVASPSTRAPDASLPFIPVSPSTNVRFGGGGVRDGGIYGRRYENLR